MDSNQKFLESVILLLLTAGLSGFLIPYILKQIDERKLKEQKKIDERRLQEQKEFEAELARQSKVIEAQAQLLENLIQQLWEFQLLALAVSYYKLNRNPSKYELALDEYDEKAWMYFGKIRTEISKAARLTSNNTYQILLNLYTDWLIKSDVKLITLARSDAPHQEWKMHHDYVFETLSNRIDEIVSLLAEELRLSSRIKLSNSSVQRTD